MKPLTIEIHGTGIHNRGAELMAIAISERIRSSFPNARIVVPYSFGRPEDLKNYGFITTFEYCGKSRLKRFFIYWLKNLDFSNIISPTKVDIVLDASGFAFSDQWGIKESKKLFMKMNRSYRRSQPLVLLPQALGTFQNPEVARWCKMLFDRAKLVCARDTQSFKNLKTLNSSKKNRLYPDFTIGVSPIIPTDLVIPKNFAAIVPNMRMLDMTKNAESYIDFIKHSISYIEDSGLTPIFVIHDDKEDGKVVQKLGKEYEKYVVFSSTDPRILKGILGKSEFVIGSRFHALVSALSQGVPCIGVGWSHKYPELFNDFSCAEFLIPNPSDTDKLDIAIKKLSTSDSRKKVSEKILISSTSLKTKVDDMWIEVEQIINSSIK